VTTGGDWGGRYGQDGHVLFDYDGAGRNHERLPDYVESIAPAATRTYGNCLRGQWTGGTTERRALAPDRAKGVPRNLGVVFSAGWPMGMTMSVDVATTPGTRYQLALYCIDWDRQGRHQVIEVFDLQTLKIVAPVRLVEAFAEGTYLLYECDRGVRLRFDQMRGDNAVLNALFFDPRARLGR
jgi:alpha-L-rhamnosidase